MTLDETIRALRDAIVALSQARTLVVDDSAEDRDFVRAREGLRELLAACEKKKARMG